jgi:hypothetical protein
MYLYLSPFSSHKCTSLDFSPYISFSHSQAQAHLTLLPLITSPYSLSSPHPAPSHHLTLLPLITSPYSLSIHPSILVCLSLSPFSSHINLTSPYSLSFCLPPAHTYIHHLTLLPLCLSPSGSQPFTP